MRLHRIRVEHVRGLAAAEVHLAPHGVTVVEAPNETGKSTLFDAVDLLLAEKDSTRKQAVRDLQPVGRDVGSLVEADLTCGGVRLTIRKRFLRDRMTELVVHGPTERRLTGDDAHDELRRRLAAAADLDLYEALRFRQGRTLDSLALATSPSLAARLDEIAGGAGDGAEDVLLRRVRAEFQRYFTPSGQEGRDLKESAAALQAAEDRVDELTMRLRAIEQDVDRLDDLEREQRRLATTLADLEPRLDEHRARLARVTVLREQLRTHEVACQAAELAATRAARDLAARTESREALDDLASACATSNATLQTSLEHLGRQDRRLAELAEELDDADREEASARAAVTEARAAADLARLRAEHDELRERTRRVDEVVRSAERAAADLGAAGIDDAHLTAIRAADDRLRLARARLGDAAPTVRVRARQDVRVEVDGDAVDVPADGEHQRPAAQRTVVRIGDVAEVEVDPGASLVDRHREVTDAGRDLAARCAAAGVADRATAEARRDTARAAEQVVADRDATLAALLAGASREQLADRLRACAAAIDRLEGDGATQPTLDVVAPSDRLERSEARERAARTAADAARRSHAALADACAQLRGEVTAHRVRAQADQERHDDACDRLASARAVADDAHLERTRRDADDTAAAARRTVDTVRAELDAHGADEVETLASAAAERVTGLRRDLAACHDQATALRARVEVRGGDGIGEALQAAQAERDRVATADRRLRARAAAARSLRDTLEQARDEAFAAYRQPLCDRILKAGRIVFGSDFAVELDEDLRIVSRHLDGRTLDWDQLSAGAREQLAILSALAAADLAGGDGRDGVPLVLDDTLGYSDPDRLERLCAVLGRLHGPQVVVLTCVGDRFRGIAGATTVRLRQDSRLAA